MADDASVMFYNPAGMTFLSGAQASVGAYSIMPKAKLSDDGSTLAIGPFPSIPVGGDATGQGFSAQPAGYVYGAAPVSEDLWIGVAVTVPFGLKNDYETDYFGRYDSTKSKLIAIDVAPTVAYRLSDRVSVGGSINFQRVDVELVSAIPNPLAPGGPSPASDGVFTVKGDDWSIGFTAGILFQAASDLRLGLSYRSSIKHRLEGNATTEFAGTTAAQGVAADLDLPDIVSAGFAYDLTPSVTLLTQVNYFGWSSFEEVRLEFEDTTEAATVEDFRDTWGVSVGAQFKVDEAWTLRGGLEYDQTPTRDAYRSTLIPDADRIWAAIGATYNISEKVAVDLSYVHMFVKTEPINRVNAFPLLATTVMTQGITKTSSNVVGLGLRGSF
jgi:long-chain fatty acid transport protein